MAFAATALALMAPWLARQAAAEPVQRPTPVAGSVIARKTGEEVQFVDVSNWRYVDLHQDLLTGDVLRTNATGQLAVLFSDHTQVRLGRNSSLQVKQMSATGDTVLDLQAGTIWARAQRGGQGLTVQTPAAAAAIRGTDWTLTVNGNQTSLIVLEGQIEFKNDLGSVQVAQGEAAVATIGQAPRKVVIVSPSDREQMLFYLTLRNGFTFMPPSPLPVPKMRSENLRLNAKPPERRNAEDWLTLAETQMSLEGRTEALESLARARALHLNSSQQARADLIDALVAGAEMKYDEAAKLFARARPRLDPLRRGIAAYGDYYSRSLADPNRIEREPANTPGPYGAVMKAYTTGFLKDIKAAIEVIQGAEKQYPDDVVLPGIRATLAILADDREQAREAFNRALAIDPTDPTALEARANYRSFYESNLDGALADLNLALKAAPGSSTALNALGLLQSERGDNRAAEVALKTSIELDPEDPISHTNLAFLYLSQSRVAEAKQEIDAALAADPAFDLGLIARGQYYLQTGEVDKALDDMLAGSTANPAYSGGQTLLAATHYEKGDRLPAAQALDNADRLDKNDPAISAFRTAVAIDDYDADGAMKSAREFLRRSQARGGHYASLGASQDAGSTLNSAFRLQGLDAWGQYYGDAVFDPFSGSAYLDQAVRGNINPLANSFDYGGNIINNTANSSAFSSLLQGLLFDPHMIAGRSRSANLARRPFIEGAIGGGTTLTSENTGWIGTAELQAFSNEPVPISAYANFQWERLADTTRVAITPAGDQFDLDSTNKLIGGTGYLTASPTPDDRFVAYYNHSDSNYDLAFLVPPLRFPFSIAYPYDVHTKSTTAGLGWSHTFGYQNVVNAALFYTDVDIDVSDAFSIIDPDIPIPIPLGTATTQTNYIAALNHTYGMDNLTWRYGVEGGWIKSSSKNSLLGFPIPGTETEDRIDYAHVYVDLLHEITPDLKAEYGLHGVSFQSDAVDEQRLEPRVGIAWQPLQGQWLRAAYMRQGANINTPTLSPIGTLGLQANEFGVGIGGYTDTIALRWDAEWNDWLFTAVDYQHQELRDLSISDIVSQTSFDTRKASVDRAAVTANVALGHGFGLSATYALTDSTDKDPSSFGYRRDLPFLPTHSGQVALTWVNEANVKATVAANYVGDRHGDQTTEVLDDYWTLDAHLTWEPLDKRFELEAAAYNLLDEDFQVAPATNGWGRVFKGTLKIRF